MYSRRKTRIPAGETSGLREQYIRRLGSARTVYWEWPASGAVIMGYSMDQTVFFQTLEQYKYNPALIVAGEDR